MTLVKAVQSVFKKRNASAMSSSSSSGSVSDSSASSSSSGSSAEVRRLMSPKATKPVTGSSRPPPKEASPLVPLLFEIASAPVKTKTAARAIFDPIYAPSTTATDSERAKRACVVCPGKLLKAGTNLDVHLKSKDHAIRLAKYRKYVESRPSVAEEEATKVQRDLEQNIKEAKGGAPSEPDPPAKRRKPMPAISQAAEGTDSSATMSAQKARMEAKKERRRAKKARRQLLRKAEEDKKHGKPLTPEMQAMLPKKPKRKTPQQKKADRIARKEAEGKTVLPKKKAKKLRAKEKHAKKANAVSAQS